jgi:hypothetical protein
MAGSARIEMDATMMDAHEAIKGLDGYAETLLSLSSLLNLFDEKCDEHQALLAQINEKQTDGRSIAQEITKELHKVGTKAGPSGDLTGISAAMQRYVAADKQASEASKAAENTTKPNEVSEAIRKFKLKAGWVSE